MCEFKKRDKIICVNTDNHPELIKDKIYKGISFYARSYEYTT